MWYQAGLRYLQSQFLLHGHEDGNTFVVVEIFHELLQTFNNINLYYGYRVEHRIIYRNNIGLDTLSHFYDVHLNHGHTKDKSFLIEKTMLGGWTVTQTACFCFLDCTITILILQ